MFGRHNRFKSRLEIERKVLGIVNCAKSTKNPLEGLTEASINKWISQRGVNKEISKLLIDISNLSSLHNDCSRDVFSEEEGLVKAGLQNKIEELRKSYSSCDILG